MTTIQIPRENRLFYAGAWHDPAGGTHVEIRSPGDGSLLTTIAFAGPEDVDAIVTAAEAGFRTWRDVPPAERARILREAAGIIRAHAGELALLDAADSGNPVTEMRPDAMIAAANFDYFAGLITEMKGASIPMEPGRVNYSVREPLGVVVRILPFNHPLMFCAGKSAAVLAAGNAVIVKPAEQAPLSALRIAELIGDLFPPGVFNVIPAGREVSAMLASHPGIASVGLVGSVEAGRAVMRGAADTIKKVILELGGKNALIAFPDSDPDEVAQAIVNGMNFGWCGQSCGSVSRAFLHADLHDRVLPLIVEKVSRYRPGLPTDPATTMGALISREHRERVIAHIEKAKQQGARLACGGGIPTAPELADGFYLEPTVFADVDPGMAVAREEIFGPVLSVMRWTEEDAMIAAVNDLPYGLTCSIWTHDLHRAHRTASRVEAGFIWVNEVSRHFFGAPFGGYKQSGLGREECLAELLSFTQEKNIHIRFG